MWFVLLIVLYQGDPTQTPDVLAKAFTTAQACQDAGQKAAAMIAKDPSGYGAVGLKCEAISNPATEKGS